MSIAASADGAAPKPAAQSRLLIVLVAAGALALGMVLSLLGTTYALAVLCVLVFALALMLRQFVLVLLGTLVVRILIDYYGLVPLPGYFPFVALIMAGLVLAVLFLWQPTRYTWVRLPYWWLFALWILLTMPSLRQSAVIADGIAYLLDGVVSAALFWMLGVQLSRDVGQIRRLLSILTAIGAVIAVHGLISVTTGKFLLATPNLATYLSGKGGLILSGSNATRLGSFLLNPDTAGAFLACIGLLAVGLAINASSPKGKALYAGEALLMFLAQLETLSTASFIALAVGLFVFVVLTARHAVRAALVLIGTMLVGAVSVVIVSPRQANVLLHHALTPAEWSLRLGAWETGLNVIRTHPLLGLGLGTSTYLARSASYQSPLQTVPLAHPHNAYLEIAAMSGLPVLLIFLALVVLMVRLMLRAYRLAPPSSRALFAAALGAVAIICTDSMAANCWTIAPTLAFAWLLIGATTSPALTRTLHMQTIAMSEPLESPAPQPAGAAVGGRQA